MRSFLILAIFYLSTALFPGTGSAASTSEATVLSEKKIFSEANAHYESKEYEKALKLYKDILNSGTKSSALYYNMGNTYTKMGQPGRAILFYERARRSSPNDSDILANIPDAIALMKQQPPIENRTFLFRWLDLKVKYLTINQIMLIICFIYFFLIGYIILTRVFGKFAKYSMLSIIFLSMALILIIFPYTYRIKNLREAAITVVPIGDVKYEPKNDAATSFTLYEGMKVYIMRTQGNWTKIKRTDGKIGWVPNEAIELIGV